MPWYPPQFLEVLCHAAVPEVIGDHTAAWGQAGLDVGLDAQSRLHCLLGKQT